MFVTAIFLNGVEYTLGTGLRRDSFDDDTLRTATWTSGVAGILSVWRDPPTPIPRSPAPAASFMSDTCSGMILGMTLMHATAYRARNAFRPSQPCVGRMALFDRVGRRS